MRWFRARAHRDRCREEVEILQAELERTVASFKRMHDIWQDVASVDESNAEVDTGTLHLTVQSGRRAYALKQAAIYRQRLEQAEECVKRAGMLLEGQMIGKKRNVAGAVKEQEGECCCHILYEADEI